MLSHKEQSRRLRRSFHVEELLQTLENSFPLLNPDPWRKWCSVSGASGSGFRVELLEGGSGSAVGCAAEKDKKCFNFVMPN